MWFAGSNVTHSVGLYGYYPWLDQSAKNPHEHVFGIMAVNFEDQMKYEMKFVSGFLIPFFILLIVLCLRVAKRDKGAKDFITSRRFSAPKHKLGDARPTVRLSK